MKYMKLPLSIIILAGMLMTSCYYDNAEDLYQNFPTDCDVSVISFSSDIQPIINQNCIGCHGAISPSAGLSLVSFNEIQQAVNNRNLVGRILLPPGDPLRMPPEGLNDCNIEKIQAWVQAGMPNN
jgi:hypothetical protein